MTYRLKLLPEARQDVKDLQQFYNKQAVGLGEYCIDAIVTDLDRLRFFAGIHPKVFGYHRSLVHRFPVSIYYAVMYDEVVVAGILDNRKNPKKIYKTLLKR
jgi:plasmid stabilization system protein ParE